MTKTDLFKTILKTINPYRRIAVSLLLVGLVVSTIYAFEFENMVQAEKETKLNPRTSSTTLEEAPSKNQTQSNSSSNNQPKSDSSTTVNSYGDDEQKSISTTNKVQSTKNTSPKIQPSQKEITPTAKLVIATGPAAGSYQLNLTKKEELTGLELMKLARDKYGLIFDYSGSGAMTFINSIGGLANQQTSEAGCQWSGKAWLLYYNNQLSIAGIGSIIINNQDNITWNYEHYCY